MVLQIRASSLCQQFFSDCVKALEIKDLQLLRDVDTRWSSTLLMVERAIFLREVCSHQVASMTSPEHKNAEGY